MTATTPAVSTPHPDAARGERWAHIGRTVGILLLLTGLLLPFGAFIINAFAERWFYPQFIPNEFSVQAWVDMFNPRSGMIDAMMTTILIASVVTLISIIIGLPAARVMGLYKFRGKRLVEFLILAPTIVPTLAVSMGLNINFIRWGLSGSIIGVALVHLVPVMPYVVLTLSGVFANYNPEYEEQARTLGAGPIATFRYVTFPAIFPGLMVAGLFAFLVSWGQYILTFLIGGGQVITMPILLFSTISGGRAPAIAVQSLVFIAPAILILLVTSRYLSGRSGAVGGFSQI